MKRLTWVGSSKKKPANAKRIEDERFVSKEVSHKVASFLDSNTTLLSDERHLAVALSDLGGRVADHPAGAVLQLIGSLHQQLSDLKLKLCNSIVENLQVPLRDHTHVCKESLKAFQQGEFETEKLEKSRSALQHRFLDYLNEVSDGFKKCFEACAESVKAGNDMRSRDSSTSSIESVSPPISPGSQRGSVMGRVFGRSLSTVLSESRTDIPPILEKIALWIEMNGMQTIGLFRIAGAASAVRSLKADIDSGDEVDFPTTTNSHVMCSLFKAYLRELPEPLIPPSLFDQFAVASKRSDLAEQIASLREAVNSMPKQNAVVLDWLVSFLNRIAAGADITKMPTKNLACLISPNILYKPDQPASVDDVSNSGVVVEMLMNLYSEVFSHVFYATKSLEPAEKSAALAASKNKTTPSDSLESSRRASDTDIIAPLRVVPADSNTARKSATRRRSSHRRIESDNSGSPIVVEDAGFLSDGTPSRAPKRRAKIGETSTELSAATSTADSSVAEPGQNNEKATPSKSRSDARASDTSLPASPISIETTPSRRLSAAEHKPRSRRGSDAGSHSRVRRGSKAVADATFLKSPSSEHVAPNPSPTSPSPTSPSPTELSPKSLTLLQLPEQLKSSSNSDSILAPEILSPSISSPNSPSASDSSSSAKDGARQRVSALLGSPDSAPGSPKAHKSHTSVRARAILDLVDDAPQKSDAIGGVTLRDESLSSSKERRRRSNSVNVSDSFVSRYKGRDRTSALATLTFANPEQFNSLMDNSFSASMKAGFIVVGYSRGNSLVVQGHSDNGGPEEMAALFRDEEVQYGLLRVQSADLGRAASRDIFVQWNGSKVNNIQKGVKKGHVGEVKEIFRPYNSEILVVSRDSFTSKSVMEVTSPQSTSHILD